MRERRQAVIMLCFLALSVALHLAVVTAWPAAVPPAASDGRALRVALETQNGAAPGGADRPPSSPAPAKAAQQAPPPARHSPVRQAGGHHVGGPRHRHVRLQVASAPPPRPVPAHSRTRNVRPRRDVPPAPREQSHAGDVPQVNPVPPQTPSAGNTGSALAAAPHSGRTREPLRPAANGPHAPTATTRLAAAAPSPAAEAAPRPLAAVASQVMSTLYQRLHARFRYPLVARMRGWEGTVKVGLRVEADGTLSHLRVIETSGYSILDENSLRTVKAITRVSGAAGSLHGRHLDLVLPVKYRLTRGG